MKKPAIFMLFLLLFGTAGAQVNLGLKIKADTLKVERFKAKGLGKTSTYLQTGYGLYQIQNASALKVIAGQTVQKIQLVCTNYPTEERTAALNRNRMLSLYQVAPELFNNQLIEWEIVIQTGCKNTRQAYGYFHGFIIHYRPMPGADAEISYMERVISGEESIEDSVIMKVFDRNKDQWKNSLVVADVTGSMSPYTAQLLLWIKLNLDSKTVKQYVFFNDDEEESATKTNDRDSVGIYGLESDDFEEIIVTAAKAMIVGNHYENNIEALLFAVNKFPKTESIILIADNWESPCDMAMLKEIKKPVKVVLCGTGGAIFNRDYLEIARASGGSFHTMEEDLDAARLQQIGGILEIGGKRFLIKKDGFEELDDI